MKALVIAPEPFFSPRGTPLSVYYRTLVAAELGLEVDLLTYGQGENVQIPGVRIIRIPAFRWLGRVKVGPSLLKAFFDAFLVLWAIGLMARHRYDLVHAHEESVFFSRYLKPIFGFKLVYDMHSILSQQLRNFEFTRSRLLIGLFRRLEDSCLAQAEAVITISPTLAAYVRARLVEPEREFLIENSLFDEIRLAGGLEPTAQDETQVLEFLASGRPSIVYAGTLEPYQGIELLLNAFARVLGERPEAVLLLLGGRDEQVEKHKRLAAALGVGESTLIAGQVPRHLAQRATRIATVVTSPRIAGSNTPLKIYEQLACGVPLVATRIDAHTQVLSDENCLLVDPEPESMASGLLAALAGGVSIARRVDGARALYERRYSPEAYREKMRRLLALVSD